MWVSLLAVMLALAALGWVVDRTVVGQVRSTVQGNLDAMLVTSVRSVTSWLDDREALLSVLSQAPRVRSAVAQAARDPGGVALLRDLLKHVAGPFNFDHGALVNAQGVIVAGVNDASLKGKPLPQAAQPYLARALRGEACVTPPMLSDLGSAESVELLAFVGVAAPGASKPDLVLVLTLDASKFSALLDQTRPGKTGESEAFDRDGRMLNESRYLDEIVAAGVLPQGTRSTILTLDLRNPGVDIRTGQRSQLPLKAQPLTQMIASAVQGGSGIDLDGYRDYRGVMCVAVWQWLEAYDFGVAVKLDRDEAYATVRTSGWPPGPGCTAATSVVWPRRRRRSRGSASTPSSASSAKAAWARCTWAVTRSCSATPP
ncbi:MAG: hypothetical protein EB084_16895 [Proteobacteria bacterium]|nr:hypothetical protein [Pseudomonadota bacterium]